MIQILTSKNTRVLLSALFCVLAGGFVRLQPLLNPINQEAYDRASVMAVHEIRLAIRNEMEHKHAGLSRPEINRLTQESLNRHIQDNKTELRQRINTLSAKIASSSGTKREPPYLLASDSYYYLDLTERILESGHVSDTFRGSKYLNRKMLAPTGHWEPLNLHPYVGAAAHRILSLFDSSIPLRLSLGWIPVIVFALTIIVFVSACRKLKCGALSIAVGGLFLSLAPIYLKRSFFGWYDNDPYSLLFAFTMIVFLSKIFKDTPGHRSAATGIIGCTAATCLYALFWQGWMFVFVVVSVGAAFSWIWITALGRNLNPSRSRTLLTQLLVCFSLSFLGISLIFGAEEFLALFKEGWKALTDFLDPGMSVWPNIYLGVGELAESSFATVLENIGSFWFAILGCAGLVCAVRNLGKITGPEQFIRITSLLLLTASLWMSLGAQRFILLLLIPLSLLATLGLNSVLHFIESRLPGRKLARRTMSLLMALTLCGFSVQQAQARYRGLLTPIFNQTWESALAELRSISPQNSIVNTWWSPGHFIKAVADRRVIFDGASINVPQAYWIAAALISPSETEALGILQMLNASGNKAAEFLEDKKLPTSLAVTTIKDMVQNDSITAHQKAFALLRNPEDSLKLIQFTHGNPPPAYIMIYKEMVDKNMQFAFVGKWDFEAIEHINASPEQLKKIPRRGDDDYIQFLWNLAGGPFRYSGPLQKLGDKGSELFFQEGVQINTESHTVRVHSDKYGRGTPRSLISLDEKGQLIETFQKSPGLTYSVLLYTENDEPKAVLMDRELALSFLVQLYFLEGKPLNSVKRVIEKKDLTGQNHIKIFEIDWQAFLKERSG